MGATPKIVEYEWDPETGMAMGTWDDGSMFGAAQPARRGHVGWYTDPHVRAFIDHDTPFPTRPTAA